MPSTEKVHKSELTGAIDSFIGRKRQEKNPEGDVEFLSIIDFIDRFKLLEKEGLFPVQRFILKLYYNIPLNDKIKTIRITDQLNTKVLYEMTEAEYLAYLYSQGRCNVREQDGRERRELILCLGRRSGKSTLSAIIAAYELYKLLCRGHPQSFYGLPSGSEIRVLCIANDKEQASIVYGDMQGHVGSVDYFKSSLVHDTQTFLKFQTENDRSKFGEGKKATITATFKSSIAKGLRGRGIICAILDELAFFVDDGKSSAERVYKAIFPSIAQFSPKDPRNKHRPMGPSHGRIIAISSPDAREGFFYRLYQLAMSKDKGSSNMLMVQAPTWEVNPTLDPSYYETEYHKDPKSFATEHGAEFSDRVRGWIEDHRDLMDCVPPELRPMARGLPREPFWAGVDFGISKDGTAISLTHVWAGKIQLAYHEVWYPRKSWRESNPHLPAPMTPYANRLQDVMRLDVDEIAEWFRVLSTRFFIIQGVFDQWAGPIFEQHLHKRGLSQFSMRNFSVSDSSQAYQTAKMLMFSRQLSLYDFPLPDGVSSDMSKRLHSPIIHELLELQATSGGKNIIIVEAPKVSGKHDDVSDSFVRSVLLASEHVRQHPGLLEASIVGSMEPVRQSTYGLLHFQRMRRRLHGPPPRERTVPGRRR
jgi:hypothetical protein